MELTFYPHYFNVIDSHHLWIQLSTVYGIALLIIVFAICITEITDNSVKLFALQVCHVSEVHSLNFKALPLNICLSLQGVYMMYLYIGSIAVIICIYVWVLVDSCSNIKSLKSDTSALAEAAELTRFGSLKKAHISPAKTSSTSFYLRIGALGNWMSHLRLTANVTNLGLSDWPTIKSENSTELLKV